MPRDPPQLIPKDDPDQLERMARYLTRPPIATASVQLDPMGLVQVTTPPDPRTGTTSKTFDPLEWIHAITSQIPDPRQHLVLYYGAYANRIRSRYVQADQAQQTPSAPPHDPEPDDDPHTKARRASWARLLRKILEIDALLCPTCGVELKRISVITEPQTVDQIIAHVSRGGGHDPFEPRGPPQALPRTA